MIIDISSDNGTVNWTNVAAAGVTDAILRLSLGYGTIDNSVYTNAAAAHAAGIRVSYYHVAYPETSIGGTVTGNALDEANYFTGLFLGQGSTLPQPKWLAVDLEISTQFTPADYQTWLQTFLDQVATNSGIQCMIYTYTAYFNDNLPANHPFGNYKLWIANYNDVPTPPLPNGWSQYYLWQYQDAGTVNGVEGNVDISKYWPAP